MSGSVKKINKNKKWHNSAIFFRLIIFLCRKRIEIVGIPHRKPEQKQGEVVQFDKITVAI